MRDLVERKVLVTGATGYVASRLLPELIAKGAKVRATSRHPEPIAERHPEVETMPSDLLDDDSLAPVLDGIEVAYYLVHSMKGDGFESNDRRAAENFRRAAEKAGVERIVYLSGLGNDDNGELSKHLRSRQEVGRILADGHIPVTEFRAAIVIGSGSVAFDMLRYLTERLPAMIAPRWLSTRIQPIAEDDLVRYLVAAATEDEPGGVVEIGGIDVLTYRQMIKGYAAQRRLRRVIVSVPMLSPRLSSYWVDLITPVQASIARPLIDGLRNEVIVLDDSATRRFPHIRPVGYDDAVAAALSRQLDALARTMDGDARPEPGTDVGFLVDAQKIRVEAAPEAATTELFKIGGDGSWYPIAWAWWTRARLDSMFGGVGLRWRKPENGLVAGALIDWWSVEAVTSDALLLRAQMKVPGDAWLEFKIRKDDGGSELRQTAYYLPRGLVGRLYWWALWPFHVPIFRLMARRLARRMSSSR